MTSQPIEEYLHNKTMQEQTPFIINANGGFYICKDELIPKQEFESYYPLADRIRVDKGKGEGIGSARI